MFYPMSFATALEEHRAPRRLGDIALRYESSMLIGQTPLPPRSVRPTIAWVVALLASISAVGLLAVGAPDAVTIVLVLSAALGFLGAVWLARVDRRRRAFVVNFRTESLRLDFVTPFAGRPRTIVVSFDAVRAVTRYELPGRVSCLTVDFQADGKELLREVLVAFITPDEEPAADRLRRVLQGAFGLGEVPADSPALAQSAPSDESTFE